METSIPVTPEIAGLETVRLAPTRPERQSDGLAFTTTSGDRLTARRHAPGIFRLTITPPGAEESTRPDYGLITASPEAVEAGIERTPDDGWAVSDGHGACLTLSPEPFTLALDLDGTRRLDAISDAHFRRAHRYPPLARTEDGWFLSWALDCDEGVYGLGEKFGPLDRRGQYIISDNQDALGVNREISYKNCPFAWSTRGWGLLIHTPARVDHAVGFAHWSHRSYCQVVRDRVLDLFLFAAPSPADMLERYTWLTGRPAPVPRWSLGLWMSRAYYKDQAEATAVAHEIRERRIPCDVITLDGRAWLDVDTRFAFEWDEPRWPDRSTFTRTMHALGLKVCVWEYPYIALKNPLHADLAAKGWLLNNQDGTAHAYEWDKEPFGDVLTPLPTSGMLDFTEPDAYIYWRDAHKALFDDGVDVIKSDFGEQVGEDIIASNGETGSRLHNIYSLLYNRCVFEATALHRTKEAGAPVVFARSGWIGSQRYPVQWGGDPQADWEGMAASVRGGLSWALTGVPFYATDIGGFYGEQPDAELFIRWTQAAVFASHMRYHGIGPREPWAFGMETEAIVRRWLEFRYRLIPYIASALKDAERTGLPLQRAMPLAFPDDRAARAFDTQFLFGPGLLVAPVLKPGGTATVYFPHGTWYDVATGDGHEGGTVAEVTCPLDQLPVFGREGHCLPLGPVGQSTADLADKPPLDELLIFGMPAVPPDIDGTPLALTRDAGGVTLAPVSEAVTLTAFGAIRAWHRDGAVRVEPDVAR